MAKDWENIPTRVALVFPDIYDIGMSNLGIAILYDLINNREDALAERVFAPWTDMEVEMRENVFHFTHWKPSTTLRFRHHRDITTL